MIITVQTKGVDMTEPIREYTHDKLETLAKFFDGIVRVGAVVGQRSAHHQKGKIYFAEVNLDLPKKYTIRVEKEAEDLYKAIDKVKDHCKVELEKVKNKIRAKDNEEIRGYKAYHME